MSDVKVLFVSDIHLKLRKDVEFEKNRFNQLFDFIKEQDYDILVLGGDIFDNSKPTLDELAIFYRNIEKVKDRDVIVIAGNHENLGSESVFDKLPQYGFIYYDITEKPLNLNGHNVYFVSHHKINKISKLKVDTSQSNILFSHIRCNIGVVKAEMNLRPISKKFDLTILGDIHIKYSPYNNIHYCGSPYTIIYEQQRQTGMFLLTFRKTKVNVDYVDTSFLPQKIRLDLNIDEYKDVIAYLNSDNLYKINLSCSLNDQYDIEPPTNVIIVFDKINDEYSEDIDDLIEYKNISIVDSLLDSVKKSSLISEEQYNKGLILFDKFKH